MNTIHESPPLAPPAEPPRKPHHRGRNIALIVAALLITGFTGTIIGVASSGTSTTPQPAASTVPTAPANPAPPTASPIPTPTVQDFTRMPLGESVTITQGGTDAANMKVTSAKVFTTAADQYGEPPQHGYYLVVHVSARTLNGFTDGFDVSSFDFYAKVAGQHFDEGNGNAYYALTMNQTELSSTTLAAGEGTSGLLVFDVPRPHGQIVYSPNYDGQPLGSWQF
jgi:hypothetical protein